MDPNTRLDSPHPSRSSMAARFLLGSAVILFFQLVLFSPGAAALQSSSPATAAAAPATAASAAPAVNESLRPALDQVGSALNQVQIDRWKLSHEMKAQLRDDANSIQQDLSSQLPALFQAARQSPAALGPQLNVMHNVGALYDVLVRITTAAGIAGGKTDAALLDNAVEKLESARKTAAAQLLQVASMQDQQIAKFKADIQAAQAVERSTDEHPKTIVVNNSATRHTRHRKPAPHRKKTTPAMPAANTPPSSTP